MMMQMVGAFAEFERAMLKERTQTGLAAARKDGRIGGRPPKLKPQQRAGDRRSWSVGDKRQPPMPRDYSASIPRRFRDCCAARD